MAWSILSTIFCFFPVGICAIVCSAKAQSLASRGRIEEAKAKARDAMMYNILCIAIFIIGYILVVAVCSK
jgi:t-SNARE complex subunit (syntaxin)